MHHCHDHAGFLDFVEDETSWVWLVLATVRPVCAKPIPMGM